MSGADKNTVKKSILGQGSSFFANKPSTGTDAPTKASRIDSDTTTNNNTSFFGMFSTANKAVETKPAKANGKKMTAESNATEIAVTNNPETMFDKLKKPFTTKKTAAPATAQSQPAAEQPTTVLDNLQRQTTAFFNGLVGATAATTNVISTAATSTADATVNAAKTTKRVVLREPKEVEVQITVKWHQRTNEWNIKIEPMPADFKLKLDSTHNGLLPRQGETKVELSTRNSAEIEALLTAAQLCAAQKEADSQNCTYKCNFSYALTLSNPVTHISGPKVKPSNFVENGEIEELFSTVAKFKKWKADLAEILDKQLRAHLGSDPALGLWWNALWHKLIKDLTEEQHDQKALVAVVQHLDAAYKELADLSPIAAEYDKAIFTGARSYKATAATMRNAVKNSLEVPSLKPIKTQVERDNDLNTKYLDYSRFSRYDSDATVAKIQPLKTKKFINNGMTRDEYKFREELLQELDDYKSRNRWRPVRWVSPARYYTLSKLHNSLRHAETSEQVGNAMIIAIAEAEYEHESHVRCVSFTKSGLAWRLRDAYLVGSKNNTIICCGLTRSEFIEKINTEKERLAAEMQQSKRLSLGQKIQEVAKQAIGGDLSHSAQSYLDKAKSNVNNMGAYIGQVFSTKSKPKAKK